MAEIILQFLQRTNRYKKKKKKVLMNSLFMNRGQIEVDLLKDSKGRFN